MEIMAEQVNQQSANDRDPLVEASLQAKTDLK